MILLLRNVGLRKDVLQQGFQPSQAFTEDGDAAVDALDAAVDALDVAVHSVEPAVNGSDVGLQRRDDKLHAAEQAGGYASGYDHDDADEG